MLIAPSRPEGTGQRRLSVCRRGAHVNPLAGAKKLKKANHTQHKAAYASAVFGPEGKTLSLLWVYRRGAHITPLAGRAAAYATAILASEGKPLNLAYGMLARSARKPAGGQPRMLIAPSRPEGTGQRRLAGYRRGAHVPPWQMAGLRLGL
jgi:hypothetical protein